ncbi:Type IV pilus biogeneis protein PilP [Candidatus Burkholderia humilis]|nr:Type IV pilus biogeneis protein PilP [Candidatus Burkholderia humilis]
MNAISMTPPARRSIAQWIAQPIDAWSNRRVVCSSLALAVAVFALGLQAWQASGASQIEIACQALDAARSRSKEIGQISAALPDLRARVAADALKPEHWSAADALHAIAQLAAQSGLCVTEIEPLTTRAGSPPSFERALKFRADGAFAEIRRFIEALSGLPRLVASESVQIKRQAGTLSVDANLRLYETLPAVPLPEPTRADAFVIDPFSAENAARNAELLLVGTLVGRHRGMALIQNGTDIRGFAAGQTLGAECVENVARRIVELSGDEGSARPLTMAEDRK